MEILLQNQDYVFVNKPSGLRTIPDRHDASVPSVLHLLNRLFEKVMIVHRIDMDTSGCLVFAFNPEAHRHASILFETRQVTKKYLGIVHGAPAQESGIIQDRITDHINIKGRMMVHAKLGKEAITQYKIIEQFNGYSLIEFHILTGRMHQIRLHCSNMGCPLLCDPIYGKDEQIFVSQMNRKYKMSKFQEEEKPILSRLALHSHYISFADLQGNTLECSAPLNKDMHATLAQMKKHLKR
jgi:23S rRNA pseudouridine1911/1915/1917 synthase